MVENLKEERHKYFATGYGDRKQRHGCIKRPQGRCNPQRTFWQQAVPGAAFRCYQQGCQQDGDSQADHVQDEN